MLDQCREGKRLSRRPGERPGERPGGEALPRDGSTEKNYAAWRGRRALVALAGEEADGDAAGRAVATAISRATARRTRPPYYPGAA